MVCISYKKGYKYQLVEPFSVMISIKPKSDILSPSNYIELTDDGLLTVKAGYAWDGPSGPTIDTVSFMRGALVHDALYQLMREGSLNNRECKTQADRLLQRMCKEDGMHAIWAWCVYTGLKIAGDPSCDPSNRRPISKAPKNVR